jgi:hypothetical protein
MNLDRAALEQSQNPASFGAVGIPASARNNTQYGFPLRGTQAARFPGA